MFLLSSLPGPPGLSSSLCSEPFSPGSLVISSKVPRPTVPSAEGRQRFEFGCPLIIFWEHNWWTHSLFQSSQQHWQEGSVKIPTLWIEKLRLRARKLPSPGCSRLEQPDCSSLPSCFPLQNNKGWTPCEHHRVARTTRWLSKEHLQSAKPWCRVLQLGGSWLVCSIDVSGRRPARGCSLLLPWTCLPLHWSSPACPKPGKAYLCCFRLCSGFTIWASSFELCRKKDVANLCSFIQHSAHGPNQGSLAVMKRIIMKWMDGWMGGWTDGWMDEN